jgi:hypothetical protein
MRQFTFFMVIAGCVFELPATVRDKSVTGY